MSTVVIKRFSTKTCCEVVRKDPGSGERAGIVNHRIAALEDRPAGGADESS